MQCLAWDSILSILEEKRMLQAILLYKLTEMNSDNGLDIWIISVLVSNGRLESWLRVLAPIPEDPGLILIPTWLLPTVCSYNSRGSNDLF